MGKEGRLKRDQKVTLCALGCVKRSVRRKIIGCRSPALRRPRGGYRSALLVSARIEGVLQLLVAPHAMFLQ